jgi:putative transposase
MRDVDTPSVTAEKNAAPPFVVRYNIRMSRYRIYPTQEQERILLQHSSHARYVWNLAVEQHTWWHSGRAAAPGYLEQCRQLTAARAENPWLAAGSQTVQQQALRDFVQAMTGFFRIIRDRAGRWHIAFAAIPDPVPAPGNGQTVGVDRGVAVSAALSTGEMLTVPGLSHGGQRRLRHLERKLARARKGSNRRAKVKAAIATVKARETDRRKDWCEKLSTDLARRFDIIRIEDLNIRGMTRSAKGTVEAPGRNVAAKAGLNRGIHRSGWGLLARRLQDKAPGRVEKVDPAFTSQRCSACGLVDRKSRESQTVFRCTACGYACNADVNAAQNIAAGRAVTARGGHRDAGLVNREPQLLLPSA